MCGIAGAYGIDNAAYIVSLMLQQLQHRGQEAAGIVSTGPDNLRQHRGFGLVGEIFNGFDFEKSLPGNSAIGHVRYSTSKESHNLKSVQPFLFQNRYGQMAVAHNGNLTNYRELRHRLEQDGATFQSYSDTGAFPHLLSRSTAATETLRVADSMSQTEGASSLLVLTEFELHAAVDPWGFRPLCGARYGNGFVFASETCALDLLGIEDVFHVAPGQVTSADVYGLNKLNYVEELPASRHCSFCHVYFSKPESAAFGKPVAAVRDKLGVLLAKRHPVKTDLVTSVPDSSNMMALSFARTLGIPFEFGLVRNHYTGRTFITPSQKAREFGVRMKLAANKWLIAGKSVTVVDDSVVRGTTSRKIAELLREAGATEVHLRVASPPVIHPCFWGIDTPCQEELIAANVSREELASRLHLDSIQYLTVWDLLEALGDPSQRRHCVTCFTGGHPCR